MFLWLLSMECYHGYWQAAYKKITLLSYLQILASREIIYCSAYTYFKHLVYSLSVKKKKKKKKKKNGKIFQEIKNAGFYRRSASVSVERLYYIRTFSHRCIATNHHTSKTMLFQMMLNYLQHLGPLRHNHTGMKERMNEWMDESMN